MIPQRLYIARIFRPHQSLYPNLIRHLKPRLFTQNAQLLLISPTPQRPQLPFLHPSTGISPSPTLSRASFQHQISRLLSTERKSYLKTNIRKGLTWGAYGGAFSILLALALFGINSERLERIYPTPPEWTFVSRHKYRAACGNENPDENPNGDVDYANQGERYRVLLSRLENPKIDGAGLRPVLDDDDRFYVKWVGKTVFDVSSKSEEWREGYHGCMMGAGHAAERLDGWLHDTTRDVVFPPEVVIGPMNPRPKPVPFGAVSAPLEEHCVRAFEDPGTYYLKILETRGFNTRQRVEAALAYADWLDFKNSPTAAEEMYEIALDIAVKGLPSEAKDIVDIQSAVIRDTAEYLSPNVLLATTAIARHHAQKNNLSAALPIFLSILRARRRLPPAPAPEPEPSTPAPFSTLATVRSLLATPPHPPVPPAGDEPQLRTPASACQEAGIMVYIGEILFASSLAEPISHNPPSTSTSTSPSPSFLSKALSFFFFVSPPSPQPSPAPNTPQSGLNWTRDAINIAETTLLSAPKGDIEARTKCAECLDAGMGNWSKMVGRMLKEARAARSDAAVVGRSDAAVVGRSGEERGRGGGGGGGDGEGEEEEERWIQEAKQVRTEMARLTRLLREEGLKQERQERNQEWGLMNR